MTRIFALLIFRKKKKIYKNATLPKEGFDEIDEEGDMCVSVVCVCVCEGGYVSS